MPEAETHYQRKRRGSSRRTHGRHWLSGLAGPTHPFARIDASEKIEALGTTPEKYGFGDDGNDREAERRRLLAIIEHNSDSRSSMLYLRPRAFRWVDLLPTAEAQEAATAAIADACTPRDLKRILKSNITLDERPGHAG